MLRLCIVGGGKMGHALAGGLLRSGWIEPAELAIAESRADARHELEHRFPGTEIRELPVPADSAVLAVKPGDAAAACDAIKGQGIRRVVSIVAGVRIALLQSHLGDSAVVLRAMPNMPAVLGIAASGLSGAATASEEDFAWAEGVLSSFGVVARVPEPLLDVVTGLSGSGPAYLFMLAEAMIEAGVGEGLDREVSRLLTNQTLLGAAHLLTELGDSAEDLRGRVTSPGGTTAAGIRELERRGFRSAVFEAVIAASERARELGERAD
ncbi:MAG: pyrroline-5-carboxylate reductase [Acidimicrobiales bacterium]